MAEPGVLRDAALLMYGLADQMHADCHSRPPCWAHETKAGVYRELGADFHQRALRAQEVSQR